nr:unnamed protein product [Digitaria exilis]
MNPKIGDFGLARLFGQDQTRDVTNRIVGTFGYMSPEYVMRGQYSTKSDVFSFGILVTEIVTGQRNTGHHFYEQNEDIISIRCYQFSASCCKANIFLGSKLSLLLQF